jgi:phenylalanyl-tRNA synthetase beta subunit
MTFPIQLEILFPFISLNIAFVATYFTEVSKFPTLKKDVAIVATNNKTCDIKFL